MRKISKKKIFVFLATCIFTVSLFGLFAKYYKDQPKYATLVIEMNSENIDEYQVFYDKEGDKNWNEKQSSKNAYTKTGEYKELKFNVPMDSKNIRIDFGNSPKSIEVKNIYFSKSKDYYLSQDQLDKLKEKVEDLNIKANDNGELEIESLSNDSYIELGSIENILSSIKGESNLLYIGMAVLSLVLGYIISKSFTNLKETIKFLKISFDNTDMIKSLSKNDFKNKYASSYLGIVWGFVNPLITILVYWFVFQVGFRSQDVGNVPYVLWFIAGIIPWFFFSESLPSATNSFLEYSYLVKKVLFKIEILPAVKILSSVFVHLFFVAFIFIIMIVYGNMPGFHSLQFIYYSFAMICLVFAVSILTSSIILFLRDLGQIIGIIVSVGFWATPIGWQLSMLPAWAARIFKLNPMYYIVTGYRDSFIDNIYFWQRPYETLYFWLFCIVTLCIGVKVYIKLKPHFSDVL